MTKQSKSALLLRIPLYLVLLFFSFWIFAWWTAKSFPENPPMGELTAQYQEKFSFAPSWPFFYKYYLHTPENYDKTKQYPLVLLLHGVSRHMRGGEYILDAAIKIKHQSFVLVPIAPEGMIWGFPNAPVRSEAAPLAYNAVRKVQKKFAIDPSRTYVSGYSMGGAGTFAMIEKYPDTFAAAVALCGAWIPERANLFPKGIPILAAHGERDNPSTSIDMVNALSKQSGTAFYREYPGVGHNVWDYVYTDARIWDWLFSQRRL